MPRFARARKGHFSGHGPNHALRVRSYATQMAHILGLNAAEQHLLRARALFLEIVTGEEKHVFRLDQGSGIIQLPVKALPCRVQIGGLGEDMPQSK